MNLLRSALTTSQAMVLGVVIVGCATAATITGHLTGSELLTALGLVGGGAVGVTGAHIGANTAANAIASGVTAAAANTAAPTVPASPSPAPPPANLTATGTAPAPGPAAVVTPANPGVV